MFNYTDPYTSTRLPVFARNIVSTAHPLTAQACVRMLQCGGDAVDAATAPKRGTDLVTVPSAVHGWLARGHHVSVIQDSYQDFGAGQFIWRMGDPAVEGYMAASDPRRDGQAAGY